MDDRMFAKMFAVTLVAVIFVFSPVTSGKGIGGLVANGSEAVETQTNPTTTDVVTVTNIPANGNKTDPTTTTPTPTTPSTTPPTTPSTTPSSTTSTAPPSTTSSTTTVTPSTTPATTTTTITPITTTTSPVINTTVIPATTTSLPPTAAPSKDRRFDGPSFVGGIVLCLGILAIGFVAFKFYKARTERNYHTL